MWAEVLKFAIPALLGVIGTLLTIKYTNTKSKEAAFDNQTAQHQAIYVALFAIRNFIVEALNQITEEKLELATDEVPIFKIALERLETLVAKAPVERQDMAMALYDLPLRLKTVIVLSEEGISLPGQRQRLINAIGGLTASLEQLDIFFGTDLQFLSEEDLQKFPKYPSD